MKSIILRLLMFSLTVVVLAGSSAALADEPPKNPPDTATVQAIVPGSQQTLICQPASGSGTVQPPQQPAFNQPAQAQGSSMPMGGGMMGGMSCPMMGGMMQMGSGMQMGQSGMQMGQSGMQHNMDEGPTMKDLVQAMTIQDIFQVLLDITRLQEKISSEIKTGRRDSIEKEISSVRERIQKLSSEYKGLVTGQSRSE